MIRDLYNSVGTYVHNDSRLPKSEDLLTSSKTFLKPPLFGVFSSR